MSRLIVHLFGTVRISHSAAASPARTTRAVQGMIAYLMLERSRLHHREGLADLFWPELPTERSRSCLSTTLWRARRILEPDGVPRGTFVTSAPSGDVGFNVAGDYWLDVAVFEAEVSRALARPEGAWDDAQVRALETALELHGHGLLDGFYGYWANAERERLRALYCEAEIRIMRHHASRGATQESLACANRILRADPLREDVHRELMGLYLRNGQRALAARQFRVCRDVLSAELGVEPSPETAAIYAAVSVRDDDHRVEAAARDADRQPALRAVLTKMDELSKALTEAQRELEQTLAQTTSVRPREASPTRPRRVTTGRERGDDRVIEGC